MCNCVRAFPAWRSSFITDPGRRNINCEYDCFHDHKIWIKSILAKVSLVLGNLNQAGVDLIESIDIAKSVTDNVIVIEALENKIGNKIVLIDNLGIDGDFIESQAFAYLSIRSYLGLPISFPETTGCKEPSTGGIIIENF